MASVFAICSLLFVQVDPGILTAPAVEPTRNVHVIYYDDSFLFVMRHYGRNETEPGLFVHSKKHGRWIQVLEVSTKDGVFSKSPPEALVSVGWDFTDLAKQKRVALPLMTTGSIAFPDLIEFEKKERRYKLVFFNSLGIESAKTVLYVDVKDLVAAFESTGL